MRTRISSPVLLALVCVGVATAASCSSSDGTVPFVNVPSTDGGTTDGKSDVAVDGVAKGGSAGSIGTGGSAGVAGQGGGEGGAGGQGGSTGQGGSQVPDADFTYDAPADIAKEACAVVKVKAEPLPLDLYFMLDTSGSMSGANIDALHQGVVNFASDPAAVGIGVSGNHFAIGGYNESCNAADYMAPAVPWHVLPYPAFVLWVNALQADGYTPSVPALTGAVNACKARLISEPTHKCVVVFVTDGQPEGNCPPTNQAAKAPLGTIAADSCTAGVPVFAIGFPNLPALGLDIVNYVAQQGCTGQAFIIQSGSMGAQFTAQLKVIQQASLGCEFLMPTTDAGLIDPDQVEMKYTPGGGTEQTLPRVDAQGNCAGDGWYYDNNNNPSKLVLCPDSCTKVKADQQGKVDVSLGCLGS